MNNIFLDNLNLFDLLGVKGDNKSIVRITPFKYVYFIVNNCSIST